MHPPLPPIEVSVWASPIGRAYALLMFRYSRNGENKWMGLGAVADKPFTEARDEAAMLRVQVKRGGHPLAEKREVQGDRREAPSSRLR